MDKLPDFFGLGSHELSPERAHEVAELQRAICQMLFAQEVTTVSQLPVELLDEVKVHVITCQENHHPVDGLIIEDA
jgi:hypothetical protein